MSSKTNIEKVNHSQPTQADQLSARQVWLDATAEQHNLGHAALDNIDQPLTIGKFATEHPDVAPLAALNVAYEVEDTDPKAQALIERIDTISDDRTNAKLNGETTTNDEEHEEQLRSLLMTDSFVKEILKARNLREEHELLVKSWPVFVKTYQGGLKNGIALGYVPADREEVFEEASHKTAVRIVDTSVVDAVEPGIRAYYLNERNEVGTGHQLTTNESELIESLAHEFTHQISGGTFLNEPDTFSAMHRRRIGFATELRPNEAKRAGFTEFITQHVTMGILTGDFETLDPDKRSDGNMVYYPVRKVGAAFVDKSQGIIDKRVMMKASFEDSGPNGSSQYRRQMLGQIKGAYGKGALHKMDKLYEFANLVSMINWGSSPLSDRLEEFVTSRIKAPVVSSDGQIIEQGTIDDANLPDFTSLIEMSRESEENPKIPHM